jgi:predicted nucleic acid-binding protein
VIVLDACVLIAFLNSADAHHAQARRLLLDSAGQERGASSLTIAEILVGPAKVGRIDEARRALHTLGISQIDMRSDAPPRLARLRADSGLKLPACCVLLAAQDVTAQAIATLDDRLAKVGRDLGFEVRPS